MVKRIVYKKNYPNFLANKLLLDKVFNVYVKLWNLHKLKL
jgi:hypothetical protein